MAVPLDDAALVRAAQSGDRTALDQLFRRHYDRVYAVCWRITGNSADAADATQEAMIAMVRGLDRFDGRASFGTWAYRIATNASLDELRRRRRRPMVTGRDADHNHDLIERADPTAVERIEHLGDRYLIDAALETVPEDFRLAVVLRDVADLDYAEIASILEVPVGTVKSRIARGRGMLATTISRANGNRGDASDRPTTAPSANDDTANDDTTHNDTTHNDTNNDDTI